MMLSTRVRLQSQVLSCEENGSCRKYIQTFQMKILHWEDAQDHDGCGRLPAENPGICVKNRNSKKHSEKHTQIPTVKER